MDERTRAGWDLSHVAWRKGSRSSGEGENCVEVADLDGKITNGAPLIAVRDSKNPAAGVFVLSRAAWATLARGVRSGRYDL